MSPDRGSGKDDLSPPDLVGQWSSPESGNPHITRGMKGCIEWPRGAQKNSLKAKLMEARMENGNKCLSLSHVRSPSSVLPVEAAQQVAKRACESTTQDMSHDGLAHTLVCMSISNFPPIKSCYAKSLVS
ncbi:hypothetical protein QYF36_015989 [Acer negundo]|nr:hypothetical protein QYF36_015989 [Acer negundo]